MLPLMLAMLLLLSGCTVTQTPKQITSVVTEMPQTTSTTTLWTETTQTTTSVKEETMGVSLMIIESSEGVLFTEVYTVPVGSTAFDVILASGMNYTLEGGPTGSKITSLADIANLYTSYGVWEWRVMVTGDDRVNEEPQFVENCVVYPYECVTIEFAKVR